MSDLWNAAIFLTGRTMTTLFMHRGEFLFMSGGTWGQLWSGIFGAVIGAVAAAGVALLVVGLTNKHQSKLAERALALQATLASQALDEQREHAKKALAEQEKALRLQLDEQRAEATKARTTSAVADMISAASEYPTALLEGFDAVKNLQRRAMSAALRWYVEDPSGAMYEILQWPFHLTALGVKALQEPKGSNSRQQISDRLGNDSSTFLLLAAKWPGADSARRLAILKSLKSEREADADVLSAPVVNVP